MIPPHINIKHKKLPDTPGVYLMKDAAGTVLYVGKATSLKRRVRQHFERPHNNLIEEMTRLVQEIDYIEKPTALEALILEANLIKLYWPKYNTDQKDDKTFLYLAITDERYPRPLLVRGNQLGEGRAIIGDVTKLVRVGKSASQGGVVSVSEGRKATGLRYTHLFGPYTSAHSLRVALELIRKSIPWSTCVPGQKRACFYVHLHQCPGVCVEAITAVEYRKITRDLVRFFEGKKDMIVKAYRRQMLRAAREKQFEEAALWRNRVHALEHIQDVAMLARDEEIIEPLRGKTDSVSDVSDKQIFSRIEGYDISHVSGSATVASMVVFERGAPSKGEYRKFKINDVEGANDVASMQEVLRRRFHHAEWRKPDLLLIDGGAPQVHAVEQVVHGELGLPIPIVGIAKGPERKRNDLIFTTADRTLAEACQRHHLVLEQVRDEAHRFAITFHRTLRSKRFLGR